jgi:hypothetical protein
VSAIRELAPAVIVERQKKWRDLVNETRLKIDSEERSTRPNVFGRWYHVFVSNISGIQRRIDAITAAIKSAEELKVQALPESEIIERLNAMEETFPPLTNDRETTTIPGPDTTELRRAIW